MEQLHEASESPWRAILEATPVPIALSDAQQKLTFVNHAFVTTFGYGADEVSTLADWGVQAFPDPRYREWVLARWQTAARISPQAPHEPAVEIDVRCKDGRTVVVQAEVTSLSSTLAGSQLAVFVDVTSRRHAEDGLRQSDLQLRGILDSMFVFVGLCALDGIVEQVNRAPFFASGPRREDVIGRALWEAPGWNHSAESVERLRDAVRRAAQGEVVRGDFEVRLDSDHVGWVDAIFGPLHDEAGHIVRIVASGTEVTERVHIGQALRDERDRFTRIAASVPGAIFSFRLRRDGTTCFPYASPTIETISGVPPEALVEDSAPIFALVHADDIGPLRRSMVESARTMLPWYRQFRLRNRQGREIWLEGHATPVGEAGGEISWHGVITEITLRKHEEMAHEKLRSQVQQAQKLEAVAQLAGGVAHDFNNLLTIINGRAEFGLQLSRVGDPIRKALLQIHDAGARAAALTQQLLSVSGNQVTQPMVLNLPDLIVSMRALIEQLIGDNIVLMVRPAASQGNIRADRVQIEQLIMNLCVNARDAMPDGGTLTIDVRDLDIDETLAGQRPPVALGPHVELTVRDTGVGMGTTVRERIFEPFFTTKPAGKGSGLGLAVVYRIVQQSGGSLWVDTAPGQGATFSVYLPRVAETQGNEPERVRESGPHANETVLVVDDEVEVGALARDILEMAGYTVMTATSGEDALAMLVRDEVAVQLVLSDVTMPGMSGVALMAELARTRPDIRVILTSGFRDDTMNRHDGIDTTVPFLGKPYSAAELRRRVRETLDGPHRSLPAAARSSRITTT
ncbi:MAG: PAS domain S-box protein [Acidobacteriota bacterium]